MAEYIPESYETVAYLDADKAERFTEFLNYSEIKDTITQEDKESGLYAVKTSPKDFEKAENLFHVFSENELEPADDNADDDGDADETNTLLTGGSLYENSEDKYKDNLSSAITFFVCGGIGLVLLVLNDLGIIKIVTRDSSSFILINAVLGILFVGFIAIGVWSLKYSKKIKASAVSEDKEITEISDWLTENINVDDIEGSYDPDIQEEMKYFHRGAYIKDCIHAKYPDAADSIIDAVTDMYIEKTFNV